MKRLLVGMLVVGLGAASAAAQAMELKRFPLNDVAEILTRSGVELDPALSADGGGSLKVIATEPTVVHLVETGDLDVENARLLYQAKLRTDKLQGQAYLEMWCHFPGKGEFFSRGLQSPVTGSTEWTSTETPFLLKAGENPDNIKLNLVINGTGTVWVDDARLVEGPLQ